MNTVVKQWPNMSSFCFKNIRKLKQIALHCGWDLFYILGIKVSNMILSKKFNIQICNFFVLNHTLNHIMHLNFSKAELIQLRFLCSYWSVSDGKPEVCTEWDLVVLCQVEQLHRHLLLFVLNPHRLFICCVETAETINVYLVMFELVAIWFLDCQLQSIKL